MLFAFETSALDGGGGSSSSSSNNDIEGGVHTDITKFRIS